MLHDGLGLRQNCHLPLHLKNMRYTSERFNVLGEYDILGVECRGLHSSALPVYLHLLATRELEEPNDTGTLHGLESDDHSHGYRKCYLRC